MKIAQIAPPWIALSPETDGGTENVLYHLVETLVAEKQEVTLFAPGDAQTSAHLVSFFPQALNKEHVPWHMHFKAYYHLQKTVEYIREHDFDIVHGHLSSSADMYLFPLLASLQTPHLITLHSTFPFDNLPNWNGDADTYFMEWALKVPVVTLSKNAQKQLTLPLRVIGSIYSGIPVESSEIHEEAETGFLIWIGRFVPEEGAHLAIKVAQSSNIPLRLVEIKDESTPRSPTYFQQEIAPHIDNSLVCSVGSIPHEQKTALLRQARALLHPIEWEEPFTFIALEAMVVGCPVITFARGAMPEIVQDGKSGFVVHTVDEMIHALPKLATLKRIQVREYVQQHFSTSTMTKSYLHAYKKLRL